MRALRVPIIGSFVVFLALLSSSGPALAGGSWIEFPREWATVGDRVTASGVFGSGAQAGLREGPWLAYLQAEDRGPLRYLAPVSITEATGNACCWRAAVTFTVPPVEPGAYWVKVCDRGCTTGVGDLVGGLLRIVATERSGIAYEIRREFRYDVRRIRERAGRAVAAAEEESKAVRARWSRVVLETRELRGEIVGLRNQLRAERDRAPGWTWILVGAAAGAAAGRVVVARRRRRPPRSAPSNTLSIAARPLEMVGADRH